MMNTDSLPDTITDSVTQTLSVVADVIDAVPDNVTEGVTTTVSRTQRVLHSSNRWWLIAGGIGVLSAVIAIWLTRRSAGSSTSSSAGPANVESIGRQAA